MNVKQLPLIIVAGITCIGLGAMMQPASAGIQQVAPLERIARLGMTATSVKQTPKAHWGIYALAEYDYSPSGKMTVIKKNELIAEQDLGIASARNVASTDIKLKTGEYEIHFQPDNSRPVVKQFIVNNLSTGIVPLEFIVEPVEDLNERKKTELVRIGPSLGDLEARIATLEKKNGIASVDQSDNNVSVTGR